LSNRTTNERFSRKAPKKRKEPRMDSTGSSLMSTTSSMQIEDIIADMGDPYDDYSGSCLAAHNCSQMFCT